LNNAQLIGANLVAAQLDGSDLRGADLTGALFLLSEMQAQNIKMADSAIMELNEKDRNALAHDATFGGAKYNDQTIWPSGFKIPTTAIYVP